MTKIPSSASSLALSGGAETRLGADAAVHHYRADGVCSNTERWSAATERVSSPLEAG